MWGSLATGLAGTPVSAQPPRERLRAFGQDLLTLGSEGALCFPPGSRSSTFQTLFACKQPPLGLCGRTRTASRQSPRSTSPSRGQSTTRSPQLPPSRFAFRVSRFLFLVSCFAFCLSFSLLSEKQKKGKIKSAFLTAPFQKPLFNPLPLTHF